MKKLFKLFLGFVLFGIAYILFYPLAILNFLIVVLKRKDVSGYFYSAALSLDIYSNREFRTLWNTALRKEGGYHFGDARETISSALGKNKVKRKLSILGKVLCFILDTIDKNHCIKSIKNFD